jgi:hypothetical protein
MLQYASDGAWTYLGEKDISDVRRLEELGLVEVNDNGDQYRIPPTNEQLFIGILTPNDQLLEISDCNSQCEGSMFDGPALWSDLAAAQDANDECGGLADDHSYCKVRIVTEKL